MIFQILKRLLWRRNHYRIWIHWRFVIVRNWRLLKLKMVLFYLKNMIIESIWLFDYLTFQIFLIYNHSKQKYNHLEKQLPFPYKVHLNFQSLQFLDVPFHNGNYSVAPLKHPYYDFCNNETFHKITSSSITSDSSIFSFIPLISQIASKFLKQSILTIRPQ